MLDPKYLRTEIEEAQKRLAVRDFKLNIDLINQLESQRKTIQIKTQELQNERNSKSKNIGVAKSKGEEIAPLLKEVESLGDALDEAKKELDIVQSQINDIALNIPNLPHESVPHGKDENDNVEVRKWGTPKEFNFTPKEHMELGEALGLMDFETAIKISGSRFVVLTGAIARLHRALIQFMLDVHTKEHGYEEIYVPYIVNENCLYGTGQLPKFSEEQFSIVNEESKQYLIATSEIPVANTVRDKILEAHELPLRYACHSPCFRSEVGSAGKDTHGMVRQHQFEKVELVCLVNPEDSYKIHEEIVQHAETIQNFIASKLATAKRNG